jgi:hypothetical protein
VLTTVSVFEDLAGAQRSTDAAADYVKQNLASLLPQSPTVTSKRLSPGGSNVET